MNNNNKWRPDDAVATTRALIYWRSFISNQAIANQTNPTKQTKQTN